MIFEVKRNYYERELTLEMDLEKELIRGLRVLETKDRDIKSLTIFCNPNHIRGSDTEVKQMIL